MHRDVYEKFTQQLYPEWPQGGDNPKRPTVDSCGTATVDHNSATRVNQPHDPEVDESGQKHQAWKPSAQSHFHEILGQAKGH